jgi:arylsulfatase A-like enzyme
MQKNTFTLFASFFLLLILPAVKSHAQDKRPNIVVFLVDDMGWMDTSVPFGDNVMALNRKYHTPNMERMVKEGMKFTNAYATSVCTPSRVSILTGMNAPHHQVTNWTHILKDYPSDQKDSQFNSIKWNYNGFSPVAAIPNTVHATPLPQLLKDAGYFTVHVGKAHWGSQGTHGANPLNLGFMVNVAGNAIGHPQSYYGKDNYGNMPGKFTFNAVQGLAEYYGTDTFLTEALTLEALKSIAQPAKTKQPFYLYLSHYAVHDPIQGDERFIQKYIDNGLEPREAKYASLIEGMDKSLGDVMDYLEEKKIANNTIILIYV